MASLSCTTKSIKLASGESFILPPGAKLIGATNASLLTAKDDCISTENLEELQCYVCLVPIGAEEGNSISGNDEQYWESHDSNVTGSPKLTGYNLNGTYTAFSTGPFIAYDPGFFQGATLPDEIKGISGVIDFFYGSNFNSEEGTLNMFIIQTIPSVANNLELVVSVDVPSINPGNANGYFKFMKYSDAVTAGYSLPTVPFCSPE